MSMWQPPDKTFYDVVWKIVKQVPAGNVTTYGQVASMIPPLDDVEPESQKRLAPRWVGTAMRNVPDGGGVPWQRVINSQGKISLDGSTGDKQKRLLEAEGIVFSKGGKVDLAIFGWMGPDDAWLDEHNLLPPNIFGNPPQQKPLF